MSTRRDWIGSDLAFRSERFHRAPAATVAARAGLLIFAIFGVLAAAEAVVRWYDRGGLPSMRLFEQRGGGPIVLMERAEARHRRWNGDVYPVVTGAFGLRAGTAAESAPAPGGWIAVGDSQVFGLGVSASETFTAVATKQGLRTANAGVPGYGVEDALERAAALLPQLKPKGVLVIVNQANDWEEMGRPVQDRFRVRGGWLLQPEHAAGWEGAFMEGPLSRVHVLFYAAQLLHLVGHYPHPAAAPQWITSPRAQEPATRKMAQAIAAFASAHADVATVVCFLPVDFATGSERAAQSPFQAMVKDRRPWEDHELRDQLITSLPAVQFVDLLPVLRDRPDAFLDQDYHLSRVGHALVADAIVHRLANPQ
jgi:hypothetical protein